MLLSCLRSSRVTLCKTWSIINTYNQCFYSSNLKEIKDFTSGNTNEGTGPCSPNPCQNGGTCVLSNSTEPTCTCDVNYIGLYCEYGKYYNFLDLVLLVNSEVLVLEGHVTRSPFDRLASKSVQAAKPTIKNSYSDFYVFWYSFWQIYIFYIY